LFLDGDIVLHFLGGDAFLAQRSLELFGGFLHQTAAERLKIAGLEAKSRQGRHRARRRSGKRLPGQMLVQIFHGQAGARHFGGRVQPKHFPPDEAPIRRAQVETRGYGTQVGVGRAGEDVSQQFLRVPTVAQELPSRLRQDESLAVILVDLDFAQVFVPDIHIPVDAIRGISKPGAHLGIFIGRSAQTLAHDPIDAQPQPPGDFRPFNSADPDPSLIVFHEDIIQLPVRGLAYPNRNRFRPEAGVNLEGINDLSEIRLIARIRDLNFFGFDDRVGPVMRAIDVTVVKLAVPGLENLHMVGRIVPN